MRIFLIGFMGAGKSYWGRELARHFQAPFFDLDELIESREGLSIADIFAQKGEAYFRETETNTLQYIIDHYPDVLVATGGGTPCFHNNMQLMNAHGKTIWLNPGTDILTERLLSEKQHRPLISDIDNDALGTFIEKKLEERRVFYQKAHIHLNNNSDLTVDVILKQLHHA